MSLFPEITSMNHEEYIEGILVSYKYFVNDKDVWWYCFDDIVEFTRMNENYADNLFNNDISDSEKETFDDWNSYDSFGHKRLSPRRFVTSEVVRQFIERNNQRNNVLIKSMNNLEFKEDAHEKYFEDDELANSIEKLHTALHNKDYEEMANQIYDIYHSETTYDILDKFKEEFDKEKEKVVDVIREKIYKDEIDWILGGSGEEEIIKISKENGIWSNWIWLEE